MWILLLLAQEVEVEVEPRVAWLEASGSFRFDEKPETGDDIDPGFDDREFAPSGSVSVRWGRSVFSIDAFAVRFQSDRTLNDSERFNETRFDAGRDVQTQLTILEYGFSYEVRWEVLGIGASVKYWQTEPRIEGDDDHLELVVPELFLRAEIDLGDGWSVLVRGACGGYDISDFRALTAEGRAAVSWSPAEFLAITIGYEVRLLRLTIDDSRQRNELDLLMSGPALSLEFRF